MLNGRREAARESVKKHLEIFGEGNYFIEIQDHGLAEQKQVLPELVALSREMGVPRVATNDCHYLTEEDARAQEVLMCIPTGKTLSDENRMRMETDQLYVKSEEEMRRVFPAFPEAIENTQKIAERCRVDFDFHTLHLPKYPLPEGQDAFETPVSYTHLDVYKRQLYVLVLLPLVILILFRYVPMYGVQIAFRNYKAVHGVNGSEWVGLKYFVKFFTSINCWPLIRNTLSINLYSLATFPLALILSLLLIYIPSHRYRKTVQLVSYAPHFISTVVMCGMLLQFLDVRTGMINEVLKIFGIEPINFMGTPSYFYDIYVWSGVWQSLGYSSIMYIAALAGMSPDLHEAAVGDGANIIQRIWHVDIPGAVSYTHLDVYKRQLPL